MKLVCFEGPQLINSMPNQPNPKHEQMSKSYIPEIFLGELLLYFLLWLWDDYFASLFSAIFGSIFLLILVISLMVEWVERSGVPRWYYKFMVASILAPVAAAILYLLLHGELQWLNG